MSNTLAMRALVTYRTALRATYRLDLRAALRELEDAAYLLGLASPDDPDASSRYLTARQGLYSMLNIWED